MWEWVREEQWAGSATQSVTYCGGLLYTRRDSVLTGPVQSSHSSSLHSSEYAQTFRVPHATRVGALLACTRGGTRTPNQSRIRRLLYH